MVTISPAKVGAWVSAIAGIVGVVFGAVNLGSMSQAVDAVVTAIGGVILAIPVHHVSAAAAKPKVEPTKSSTVT